MPGGIMTGLQVHVPELAAMLEQPAVAAYMKNPAQGAATTVWAAIGSDWKNNGGRYLEDVAVTGPWDEALGQLGSGYAKTAYQPEDEERLWDISCKLVGVPTS
jgi:hypothetical protein